MRGMQGVCAYTSVDRMTDSCIYYVNFLRAGGPLSQEERVGKESGLRGGADVEIEFLEYDAAAVEAAMVAESSALENAFQAYEQDKLVSQAILESQIRL